MNKFYIIWIVLFFCCQSSFAQQSEDSKIITTIDTALLYNRIKYALVNNEFIVKDNGNNDTLTTYVREYDKIYCTAQVVIAGNAAVITGYYGLKRVDYFSYNAMPKSYKPIIYYKGSKSWKLLVSVARDIGGEISFSK